MSTSDWGATLTEAYQDAFKIGRNDVTQCMRARGYDDDAVTAMLCGDWLRHLELADERRGA